MENAKPFYDLCVHSKVATDFYPFAKKCVEFGYRTIAIDQILDLTAVDNIRKESKKKNKKGADSNNSKCVPAPIKTSVQDLDLTVLNRLTVICNDKDNLNTIMHYGNFSKYHIFAVIARTNEIFQHLCDSVEVDIISFEPLDIKGVKITRKMYNKAVTRGIHFEIMYFPAIVDQTARKNIISRSHLYHQIGRSKNIIITSGCNSVMTLRGPYDVINLGLIFGLTEQQSKFSINYAAANVLKHSLGRKIGKAIVFISDITKNTEEVMDVDDEESNETAEPTQKKLKTCDIITIDP